MVYIGNGMNRIRICIYIFIYYIFVILYNKYTIRLSPNIHLKLMILSHKRLGLSLLGKRKV